MFSDLQLHDETLQFVQLDWATGSCTLQFSSRRSEKCELKFFGVSELNVPKQQPWGPSVSVNALREIGGAFEIEMQSGDVLRVAATSWSFNERGGENAL